MSIQDNYEINVAKRDTTTGQLRHYCKIELQDAFESTAMEKFDELKNMFGDEFQLSLYIWECRGRKIVETNDVVR